MLASLEKNCQQHSEARVATLYMLNLACLQRIAYRDFTESCVLALAAKRNVRCKRTKADSHRTSALVLKIVRVAKEPLGAAGDAIGLTLAQGQIIEPRAGMVK